MSATTVATTGGLHRSHASDENKSSGRAALKAKGRAGHLKVRPTRENPTHPGKAIHTSDTPLATPRKALSEIQNAMTHNPPVSHTPSQKVTSFKARSSQLSKTKSERRIAPNKDSSGSLTKPKQSKAPSKDQAGGRQSTVNRAMPSAVGPAVKEQAEDEWTEFPDIETMPAKVDDLEQDRLFVPPAYFEKLTSALTSTPLPPTGVFPYVDPLRLNMETVKRPSSFRSDFSRLAPLYDPLGRDDLLSSVDLPDLDNL